MVNPDFIIPPDSELAQLLLQWSEDNDSRTWHIANLTNELIDELEGAIVEVDGKPHPLTKTDIYKTVAKRCKGRKPNTIRRIAEVAVDFDKDVQDKYAHLLSFEHFKLSRRLFAEGKSPTLEYVLEWCVEGNDDKLSAGKFKTVGDALHHFLPEETFVSDLKKYWQKSKDKLYDLILCHDNDVERQKMLSGFGDIDDVIERLDKTEHIGYTS